jgi:hypothetical protein
VLPGSLTQLFDFGGEASLIVGPQAAERDAARRIDVKEARRLLVGRELVLGRSWPGVFLHVVCPCLPLLRSDRWPAAVAKTVDLARESAVVVCDEALKDSDAIREPVDLLLHLANDGLVFARAAGHQFGALVPGVGDDPNDRHDHCKRGEGDKTYIHLKAP